MGELDDWRHCPRCAAAVAAEAGRVECAACGFVTYASSKPTASALVEDGAGRLLLVRRAREPFVGYWDTPGGFLEEGEEPLDALRRELLEETGLEIEPVAFFAASSDRYGSDGSAQFTLNLYWTARVVGGVAQAGDDAAELEWFAPESLPPDDRIAFTALRVVIADWRAARLPA